MIPPVCPTLVTLLLAAAFTSSSVMASGDDAPLQTVLLFRHGERNAMRQLPIDPHAAEMSRLGWAQLLDRGVSQLYQLGVWLRNSRHGNWLPRRFNSARMEARSTDTDRTLMSAQALLAGLFPEQCCCHGNSSSMPPCYPVPLRSQPKSADQLLKMSSPCAAYKRRWRQFRARPDGEFVAAAQKFDWLARLTRNRTGWPQVGDCQVTQLWRVGDSVSAWRRMGLRLPDWANQTVLDGLDELKRLKFVWKYAAPELHSARVGLLVARLLGDMRARLEGKSDKQLKIYSTHDSTVAALLHAFQVFNGLQPPMASCIIAELRADGEVLLMYKNSTELPSHQLQIPFCPSPCLLTRLETQMRLRGVWADSVDAMCGSDDKAEPLGTVYFVLLLTALAAVCVPLVTNY